MVQNRRTTPLIHIECCAQLIMYQKGNIVKETKYGFKGMIEKTFKSWEDLKSKQAFLTIDPDNESGKMDVVEKMISGDPKDAWLEVQEIPFTAEQLEENWYSVRCLDGGEIWTCESSLEIVDNALN